MPLAYCLERPCLPSAAHLEQVVEASLSERIFLLDEGQSTAEAPTAAEGEDHPLASLSVKLMIEEPDASIAHVRI